MQLNFINEGFGFKPSITTKDYENFKNSDSKVGGGQFLRQSGRFTYSEVDNPDDFIFIEPVMKSKSLSVKPTDPASLSTFEGAQIIYGFAIRDPEGFQDSITKNESDIPEVQQKLSNIEELGWPSEARSKQLKDLATFKELKNEWNIALPRMQRDMGEDLEEYQISLSEIDDIINMMEEHGVSTPSGLLQQLGKTVTSNKAFNRSYLGHLQYAFAKAVKNPGADDLEVYQQFLKLSVQVFLDKSQNQYDIIMYPKSSRSFNKNFADEFARATGAESIEIPKRKVKEVIFNHEEMLRRAGVVKREYDDRLGRVPTEQEWVDREINKLRSSLGKDPEREAAIKNIKMGDKRRYAQLFKLEDPDFFEGFNILLIDDNVAHQGTMEMLHALIQATRPGRLDLYTPLLLRNFQ